MLVAVLEEPKWLWIVATLALAGFMLAALSTIGWIRIFGPVLHYEAIRVARRGRYFLLRVGYAGGLLLLLLWIHMLWRMEYRHEENTTKKMVELAAQYFTTYAVVQYFAVILLTPAYVAGCIADDKERRVLEFLLATDLSNQEIIFGKLVARVGNLLMLLLAGIPVLSCVQFFGGIDPLIMLVVNGATVMTMLGLVGISMVNSVQRRRGRDAVIVTYAVAFGYLCVCQLLWVLSEASLRSREPWVISLMACVRPCIDCLRWGDPTRAVYELGNAFSSGSEQGYVILAIFQQFAIFHGLVFVLGVSYAVWRIRKIALAQASSGDGPRKAKQDRMPRTVSNRPMVWKEVVAEGSLKLGFLARWGLNLLIACGFIPVGVIFYDQFGSAFSRNSDWTMISTGVNAWLRYMNTILTTLMLMGIAVRAAGSIGSERDRDTLISLLTTPLSIGEIIAGKFWGALASVRKLGYWLGAVWLIGLGCGAVSPLALPVQLLAMAMPACAAAAFGIYCSVACSTTLRGLTLTMLGMLFGLGGHWVFTSLCCFALMAFGGASNGMEYFASFLGGMTPPAVFGLIPCTTDQISKLSSDVISHSVFWFIGHLMWCGVAAFFLNAATERFSRATHRLGMVRRVAPSRPAA